MATHRPRVSVVIPAYQSHATIARCLRSLDQQTWRDFETIVVDSSAGDETARIISRDFSAVHLVRSESRLFPQAARNRGIAVARGELFAFTDSHMYAHPAWLARAVAAHDAHGNVVSGAIACFGSGVFDRAVHLCKFAPWLPYGERREIELSPTGNMLIRRDHFDLVGGFTREGFLGDVVLSRALRDHGIRLMFQPDAVVEHEHEHSLRSFLAERFARGSIFGDLRSQWLGSRIFILMYLLTTILPVRFVRIAWIAARLGVRAEGAGAFLQLPVAMLGHAAWLAGESAAYARALIGNHRG